MKKREMFVSVSGEVSFMICFVGLRLVLIIESIIYVFLEVEIICVVFFGKFLMVGMKIFLFYVL